MCPELFSAVRKNRLFFLRTYPIFKRSMTMDVLTALFLVAVIVIAAKWK